MRLHFQLTPNTQTVPFDYQHFLTGAFHKWLGDNDLHDEISLYSLGWLHGGVTMKNGARIGGLDFPNGARWFVSAHDGELMQRLADGALRDGALCCGMNVTEIRAQKTPNFGARFCFKAGSPILARSKEIEGRVTHYTHLHEEADAGSDANFAAQTRRCGLGFVERDCEVRPQLSQRESEAGDDQKYRQ